MIQRYLFSRYRYLLKVPFKANLRMRYPMRDEWRKRRKRPWFDFFVEFKRIEKMMDEMMRRSFRRSFKPSKERSRFFGPRVYGFTLSIGSDGKPRIREFGNVQRSRFGPRVRREREPLVDVLEENGEIVVVAELPGVEKENINLHASRWELIISVNTPKRKYYKRLFLPKEVDPRSTRVSYKNGVFQVRLKKVSTGLLIRER